MRPNITLSYGLRFETQNDIHDRADWAPRIGFAWGVGGKSAPPKVVIRGGFGIFYDRFQSEQILQAERVNGVVQQQFVIDNPTCFPVATNCDLSATVATPTVYQVSPRLHAPYTLQTAVSVERQVTKSATVSVTYLNSRGFDQFATINANAPLPDTGLPPNPNEGNIYQYISEAKFRQNQLDREQQRAGRIEAAVVRLLHAELCEQRRLGCVELRVEFLQHQPGLWASDVRYAAPVILWRKPGFSLSNPAESVSGGEFRDRPTTSRRRMI